MIRHWCVAIVLAAASSGAWAQWVKLWTEPDGSVTVHVDPKSVSKKAPVVALTILKDFRQPQPLLKPYLSTTEQFEVKCKDGTFRDVQATFFEKNMAQGEVLHKADRSRNLFSPVQPDTHFAAIWQYACKRKLPATGGKK
jgi:hypothetical protein